ncbi:hypothetical protein ZIOFF_043858 [Zingiber officinale]|uniref:Glutaredoxin-dependent peroxiredoxin n=1 Tax=Zingiber officinale TaxID=94328 RepID=A0A8J5FU48_ZINOF|nr:hypothetical protein ZIOFF_043858 [Zingiber officinale]
MASISVGDVLPDGELAWFDESNQLQMISVHWLAAGKKVVLFAVPGAFTPICSMIHLPGFIESAEELKSKGVDEILLISGTYTRALGLELDLSDEGLGTRSRRFALLVDNLVVTVANIEEGGEFTISGAEEILKVL